jgi:chromosome segregation ATPase
MAEVNLLHSIISGLLSGGTSAGGAIFAVFSDLKKRLAKLETQMGAAEDPKTGLFLVVERMDDTVKRLKREIDGWEDEPPSWVHRLSRVRMNSSSSIDQEHLETLIDQRFKTNQSTIKRVESSIDELRDSLAETYIKRAEFEQEGRKRSEELGKIREQLATVNGLLRGVMSALGYLDTPDSPSKPVKIPR